MGSSTKLGLGKEEHQLIETSALKKHAPTKYRIKMILMLVLSHAIALYAIVFKLHQISIWTILYTVFLVHWATFGSTAGAHRLWSHRAYKAKTPLRVLLLFGLALAGQLSVYVWVRTHRVHHKYTDTDLDPHNSTRGFWFSHYGWLVLEKSPEVRQKEKEVDMSDILADPLATFHSRWFYTMAVGLFFLPALVPVYVWGEDLYLSVLWAGMVKQIWAFHNISSINSIAHMFGSRPYDKRIRPVQSLLVAVLAMGEGWHNYHHTFPWDYKSTEFGGRLDWTGRLLELFAKIGWAYDLRTASPELIASTKAKYGDGNGGHAPSVQHDLQQQQ